MPVRLARVRHLVGVLAAVLERADAAGLRGVGSAEAREATPHGDGDGVRRGGGHDAGADEQRADGHGPAVADGPRPRAPLALLAVHEGRALVREEWARHLVRRCAVHHGVSGAWRDRHGTCRLRAGRTPIDAARTTKADLDVSDAGKFVEYEDRCGSILARDVPPARQTSVSPTASRCKMREYTKVTEILGVTTTNHALESYGYQSAKF